MYESHIFVLGLDVDLLIFYIVSYRLVDKGIFYTNNYKKYPVVGSPGGRSADGYPLENACEKVHNQVNRWVESAIVIQFNATLNKSPENHPLSDLAESI